MSSDRAYPRFCYHHRLPETKWCQTCGSAVCSSCAGDSHVGHKVEAWEGERAVTMLWLEFTSFSEFTTQRKVWVEQRVL